MKLSTKGRYAVTAMMDLAISSGDGPVALAEISERQGISLSYLEQLFSRLRRGGLVTGTRGPGGGYRLASPAESITIANIIVAVDENVDAGRWRGQERCQDGDRCLTHDLWSELSHQIHGYLDGITLASIARRPDVREAARRQAGK